MLPAQRFSSLAATSQPQLRPMSFWWKASSNKTQYTMARLVDAHEEMRLILSQDIRQVVMANYRLRIKAI